MHANNRSFIMTFKDYTERCIGLTPKKRFPPLVTAVDQN